MSNETAKFLTAVEKELGMHAQLNGSATIDPDRLGKQVKELVQRVVSDAEDIAGDEMQPEEGESAGSYVDRIQTLFETFMGDALHEEIAEALGTESDDEAKADGVHNFLMLSVARAGIAKGFR